MSSHTGLIVAHQLDKKYDGDKTSLNIVYSDDAIEEGTKFLNSPEAFLNPNGGLYYGFGGKGGVTTYVLHTFTRGLEE